MNTYRGFTLSNYDAIPRYKTVTMRGRNGGSVPEVLKSLYTSDSEAKKAIDAYLNSKGGSNANKTRAKSGD